MWHLENSEHFCLSFSLNRDPEEVIDIYGASPREARLLPLEEAPSAPLPEGAALRVGKLGDWAFCLEFENPLGYTDKIIRDLSQGTETIIFYRTAKALKVFLYAANGEVVEWFEPGYPPSSQGRSPYAFTRKVQSLISAGKSPISACLDVVNQHIGQELTMEMLRGPLLSIVIGEPNRDELESPDPPLPYPNPPQGVTSRLGRRL